MISLIKTRPLFPYACDYMFCETWTGPGSFCHDCEVTLNLFLLSIVMSSIDK